MKCRYWWCDYHDYALSKCTATAVCVLGACALKKSTLARFKTMAAEQIDSPCTWSENFDGYWATSCGGLFSIEAGTPEDNTMRFCCFCGEPLLARKYSNGNEE